jgi:hypothetical protein
MDVQWLDVGCPLPPYMIQTITLYVKQWLLYQVLLVANWKTVINNALIIMLVGLGCSK